MEQPIHPEDLNKIEQEHMTIDQQSLSEARENLWTTLTPEQKKMALGSTLKAEEVPAPAGGGYVWMLKGEVTVDGERLSIETRYGMDNKVSIYIGKELFTGEQAQEIFDFYAPIAKAITDSQRPKTNESNEIYRKKLADKILGK